jgi:sigma-54-specific transcriptional regulator
VAEVSALERLTAVFQSLLGQATPQLFQAVESALVHVAFAHTHEDQVHAARVLGITRNTMRTLLKRHGLLLNDSPLPPFAAAAANGETLDPHAPLAH